MRKLCLALCFVLSCLAVEAQTSKMVYYVYDNAGNRTARYCVDAITLKSATLSQEDSVEVIAEPVEKGHEKYEICKGETTFDIYPNPTSGNLFFEITSPDEIYEDAYLKLYNAQGKELYRMGIVNSICVDMNSYPSGVYVLELERNSEKYTWKIVKE